MKKIFTLFIGSLLVLAAAAQAPATSLNLDFSDPAHADRFTPIIDEGGEFVKTVANGEMKIVVNKKEWHFLQVYINPFDFIHNPYISFRIKADQPTPVRIWLKQADGTELTVYDQTVAAGPDYQPIGFKVENAAPLTTDLSEVGIDIGGYQVPPATFAGAVYFDEFKLGTAAAAATSLDLDFSTPEQADRMNYIVDAGGEVTKTVANGELKLVLNKKEWHFFQVFILPFDFLQNPYLRFRVKADQNTPIRVWVNQPGGANEKELFNQTIAAGTGYQTIQVKVDNAVPLNGYLQELNFDIGGYQVPPASFAGTVYFDEIKLGEAAKPVTEVYGTSYHEDFSMPLYAGWAAGEGFDLSQENNALKIQVNRSVAITDAEIAKLPSLGFEGKVLDIHANPYLNLSLKGNDPFTLSVIALDNLNQKKEFKARIIPSGNFQQVSFDLSSLPGLDLGKIEKLFLDFNHDGFAFSSTILIDEISIGTSAQNLAGMDAISDKLYYQNSGTKKILLSNIRNASSVTTPAANGLIQNASVSAIGNGAATLTFTLKANKTGTEPVVLTLNGAPGYTSQAYTFNLTIEGNLPPTLDSIVAIQAEEDKKVKINLTGITDGNIAVEQSLSFTVTSSNTKSATGKVTYPGEGTDAVLTIDPKKKGTALIEVAVKDNGHGTDTRKRIFRVDVFKNLNAKPVIDSVAHIEAYQDAGPSNITLTGIDDGDKERQPVQFIVSNSAPGIVKNVSVTYRSGTTAVLNYTPVADTTGVSTITIKLQDEGGNNSNQGDASTSVSFTITVLKRPVTGYVATLNKSIEGFNGNDKYVITEVDSANFKALVFKATDKFYWDGVIMDLPQELDLSKHPYMTMEIYPVGQNTLHWMWFYDVNGNRNDLNNLSYAKPAIAGQWNKLVFNFSGPNDWINTALNAPINNKRVKSVLLDMHNAPFVFPPPPNYTGTFIIRNIRIGSEADFTVTPTATINPEANQVAFVNKHGQKVELGGISNGKGSTSGTTLTVSSTNSTLLSNLKITPATSAGKATLSYSTGATVGKTTVTVTVSASGSSSKQIGFDISVLSNTGAQASVITLNTSERFQTIRGFGTFSFNPANIDAFTKEMGGTAMRLGLIGNQFEPVNDNDDPNVLNMQGFNYDAFDWEALKTLKERGVQSFILTSWSPPAWMKTNLSLDNSAPGYSLNTNGTTNRLDFSMYDEFAESMVAVVRAFRQRAGIDLLAIGLQNEPAFHEPYPSAILGPNEFVNLIKVVGRRFKKEGIKTKLYMPEHVSQFVDDINLYLRTLKADPEADQYCDVFAVHGYGSDGIEPGQPKFEEWQSYRDSSAAGNHPKEVWMTETNVEYGGWQNALDVSGAIYGALTFGNVSLWTQWAFEGPFVQQGTPTGMLYAVGNYAKFVRPGDTRITATSGNDDVLSSSFIDKRTGRTTVVLVNKGDLPLTVRVQGQGVINLWAVYNSAENRNLERVDNYNNGLVLLPARSVTTLIGLSILRNYSFREEQKADAQKEDITDDLRVYPNPGNGNFHVENRRGAIQRIEIVDLSGKVRYQASIAKGNYINATSLPDGVYFVKVYDKEGVRVRKIIIAKQ